MSQMETDWRSRMVHLWHTIYSCFCFPLAEWIAVDRFGHLFHTFRSIIPTHCQLRRQMTALLSPKLKVVCGRDGVPPCYPFKVRYGLINGTRGNRS
ncbi:hypothetical protein BDV35DRAFT_318172 [Aspergillus flavus]|uniref:Uncharacterized protein n=1 Tax=Aspergillus flavus TaxID=5059 RepID=A0A5N6HBE8_ASPFL|nr:hypothetical protein BDV35DRAFT_318172 [Aspergillus flavus]